MSTFSWDKYKIYSLIILIALTAVAALLSLIIYSCSACLSSRIILGVYILLVGIFHTFIIQQLIWASPLYGLIFMFAVIFGIPLVGTSNSYLGGVLGFVAFVLSICLPIMVTELPLREYIRLLRFWEPTTMKCVYMPDKDFEGNPIGREKDMIINNPANDKEDYEQRDTTFQKQ